jgi:predicted permease
MAMNARLARLIVRAAAWLAPRAIRDRWREEWLAEISASGKYGRAAAAPRDAIVAHRLARLRVPHEARGARIAGWLADLKYAARSLRRAPGHALTVTLSLGAALIACLSVFSLINTALYGDIPGIADRQRLGALYISSDFYFGDKIVGTRFGRGSVSAAEYDIIRTHGPGVAGVAAEGRLNLAVRLPDGEVVSVIGAFVSGNYFEVLGSSAVRGRVLGPADDSPAASAIVVSHRLWQRQLGEVDTFSQRPVLVGGRPMTIVGIAPDEFLGLEAATPVYIDDNRRDVSVDVWLPMPLAATWPGVTPVRADAALPPRDTVNFRMVVRPAPDRSFDDAQRDLQVSVSRLDAVLQQYRNNRAVVRPFGRGYFDSDAFLLAFVSMVLAAPLLVLIIACANVANLRLARFLSQQRELAVRLSLGGTRVQVLRLLVIETAALAGLAAFIGWAGTMLVLWQFGSFLPGGAQMDYRVFAFGVALVVIAIGLSGVWPGWLTTKRLAVLGLKQTAQAGGLGHARLRHSLVVVQVALSIVLLLAGALFTRAVQSMTDALPAQIDDLLVADLDLSQLEKQPAEIRRFLDALLQRLGADARAEHIAVANIDLYGHSSRASRIGNETQYLRPGDSPTARNYARIGHVTPAWFDAMGLDVLGGRSFRPDEIGPVAVVNRTFADRFGAGPFPLGHVLQIRPFDHRAQPPYDVQIIGVVSDAPKQPDLPTPQSVIYLPLREATGTGFSLYVRSANADALIPDFRRTVSDLDPRAPWAHFESASSRLARDRDPFRYLARSVAALGVLALLLAVSGLYAVIAYLVSLRTREIGVRVAIGARAADVIRLVLRQAIRLVILGSVAGFVIALPLFSYIRELFVGVSPFDPLAVGLTAVLLLAVGFAAAALPARRAARIDPIRALRQD